MVNPTEYASSDKKQKYNVENFIEEFADDLITMSGKCMDIGCGPGEITTNMLLPALPANSTIIGTDIAKDMIKYANAVYADNEHIVFEELDIQTKNLPKKYISEFDHIFSFHTLHWCSDIRQAFENIYEMLRPGGTMMILLASSDVTFDIFEILSKDLRYAPYIGDIRKLYSPLSYLKQPQKEVKKILKNIGFEIHHCSNRDMIYFNTNMEFLSSIMSITSFLDKMPHDRMRQFRMDYEHEYMKKKIIHKQLCNGQEQSVILDLYKALIVYAEK